MTRLTSKYLYARVKALQDQGFDIEINRMISGWRITNKSESRDLSPRLKIRAISDWLDGYCVCHREMSYKPQYESHK